MSDLMTTIEVELDDVELTSEQPSSTNTPTTNPSTNSSTNSTSNATNDTTNGEMIPTEEEKNALLDAISDESVEPD